MEEPMADIDILPPDVVADLKASGVKFNDEGNIIQDAYLAQDDEEDDLQTEDKDLDTQEDDPVEDGDAEELDVETPEDEEDDEPAEDTRKKLSARRLALTRRKEASEDGEDSSEKYQRENAELRAQLAALLKDDEEKPEDAIKKEAMRFKHMRLQEFKNSVVRSVNELDLGGSFQDIIASEEWSTYLNTKVFGVKVSDMLKNSIEETKLDDVVSFYADFTDRYLPSVAKTKSPSKTAKTMLSKSRANLADLATPKRAEVDKRAGDNKRSGFLYTETDYGDTLSKAERGLISFDDFVKFEAKFNAAKKAGKVKLSV
jgi:hypothetical protein